VFINISIDNSVRKNLFNKDDNVKLEELIINSTICRDNKNSNIDNKEIMFSLLNRIAKIIAFNMHLKSEYRIKKTSPFLQSSGTRKK
jgi:hypothetical protein